MHPLFLLFTLSFAPTALPPGPQDSKEETLPRREILWIPGGLEEVKALSKASGQLILVEVETAWCDTCGELEEKTLHVPDVVDATLDFLCLRVNAETPEGIQFCLDYRVGVYPTILVLEPDGTVRDRLSGFFSPPSFVAELERVARNENTLSFHQARVAANPDDLEARLALARKLRKVGDLAGSKREIEHIRANDVDCTSLACRTLRMEDAQAEAQRTRKPEVLYRLLEGEEHPRILHGTWMALTRVEGSLARSLKAKDPDQAKIHYGRFFVAVRLSWRFAPKAQRPKVAENLAWEIYRERDGLPPEALELGMRLGERAVEADRGNISAIEVLGRLNLAAKRYEEANLLFRMGLSLQPENAEIRRLSAEARQEIRGGQGQDDPTGGGD